VGSGGVVRDPALRHDAVMRVVRAIEESGGRVAGAADSGTPGPKGNREVFVLALGPDAPGDPVDVPAAVSAAVADGG